MTICIKEAVLVSEDERPHHSVGHCVGTSDLTTQYGLRVKSYVLGLTEGHQESTGLQSGQTAKEEKRVEDLLIHPSLLDLPLISRSSLQLMVKI